eukprot:6629097-Prymnesium_polylepis.1
MSSACEDSIIAILEKPEKKYFGLLSEEVTCTAVHGRRHAASAATPPAKRRGRQGRLSSCTAHQE